MSLALFSLGHGPLYNVMTQALARGQSKAAAVLEEEATEASRAKRAILLKGSGAFQSALMTPPADSLRAHLAEHRLPHPSISLVSNVATALVVTGAAVRDMLIMLLTSPTQWSGLVATMVDARVDRVMEIGLPRS